MSSHSIFEYQIANFQAPGRYILKPGMESEKFKKPSSESGRYTPINVIEVSFIWLIRWPGCYDLRYSVLFSFRLLLDLNNISWKSE